MISLILSGNIDFETGSVTISRPNIARLWAA